MRYALILLSLGLLALVVISYAGSAPADLAGPEQAISTEQATVATEEPTASPLPGTLDSLSPEDTPPRLAREQFRTDFAKHSVPYTEIRSGGPRKDGIPAIDSPVFVDTAAADEWLGEREAVILVEANGDARAYPVQIFMFHEIVNDTIGGEPVSVTYCPLCNSGAAFERTFDGQVLDFGTTGYLRNSNLVMYDRQTETWWQQATGEGLAGEFTGRQLEFVPAALVSWADFKEAHPEGKVLSRETGFAKPYGLNPYTGYDQSSVPFLFGGPAAPEVLPLFARVLTIDRDGEAVAYPYEVLEDVRVVNDTVDGLPIVVLWAPGTASALDTSSTAQGEDVGAATTFKRELEGEILTFVLDGDRILDEQSGSEWNVLGQAVSGPREGQQLDAVVSINHFWFSWYAFKPDTRVWRPSSESASEPAPSQVTAPTDLDNDFSILLYQGQDVLGGDATRLSQVLGLGKPVVLNMWAGQCPVCRGELPRLQELHEKYGDRVLFLGIDVGPFVGLGTRDDAMQLMEQLTITYPNGTTPEVSVIRDYKVLGTPSTYFMKPNGEIMQQWTGAMGEKQLEGFIQALIEASQS
jgi:thiol-disulfide isomerase/thioredoxin